MVCHAFSWVCSHLLSCLGPVAKLWLVQWVASPMGSVAVAVPHTTGKTKHANCHFTDPTQKWLVLYASLWLEDWKVYSRPFHDPWKTICNSTFDSSVVNDYLGTYWMTKREEGLWPILVLWHLWPCFLSLGQWASGAASASAQQDGKSGV
jgi:hypothetical protein